MDSLPPLQQAGVAQLVEHHLAKVAVESSNLFARSNFPKAASESAGGFPRFREGNTRGSGPSDEKKEPSLPRNRRKE